MLDTFTEVVPSSSIHQCFSKIQESRGKTLHDLHMVDLTHILDETKPHVTLHEALQND